MIGRISVVVVCDDGRKRVLFLVRLLLVVGEFLGKIFLELSDAGFPSAGGEKTARF